jgi:RNA-directed DNA polymerase
MRTPDIEGVAIHDGPESCAGICEGGGEALTGVRAGQPLSREITTSGCRRRLTRRKAISPAALARAARWTPRGLRTCACTESFRARTGRSRRSPARVVTGRAAQGRLRSYA